MINLNTGQKKISEEIKWIKSSIKTYQDGLKIAIKYENKEKEEEYRKEIIGLLKKLSKIERLSKKNIKNRNY